MEIVDAGDGARSGQAGYVVTGSGGGGAGGRYVFASLDELNAIIGEWKALRDRIKSRGGELRRAIGLIEPPAGDMMSRLQAGAAVASLEKAEDHRQAMEDYATGYLEKVKAARARYVATDEANAADVRRAGGE